LDLVLSSEHFRTWFHQRSVRLIATFGLADLLGASGDMRGRDLGDLGVNRGARLGRDDRLLSSGDASLVRSSDRAVCL
jgi:hypothetical protein